MNRYEKYIGSTLAGRYRIQNLIGLGGTSVVFKGIDTECDDRTVAVKMLREELWGQKAYIERMLAEADTVAALDHECIAKLYDRYVGDDMQFLVMEYVEGITLRQYLIKKGRLEVPTVISIVSQILATLDYLHSKGMVHGDIKPQNILLQASGRIVLSDFGVARQSEENDTPDSDGKAVGTVYYLSPEQARGREACKRSDLYSLGVMMYEMVTGQLPFEGDTAEEVTRQHIECHPVSARMLVNTLPKGMEQIIFGAMEKQLPMRYQTAAQMRTDLLALREDAFAVFAPHPGLRYIEGEETAVVQDTTENKIAFPDLHVPLVRKNSNSFLSYMLGICFAFLVVGIVVLFYGYDRIFKDSKLNVFSVDVGESVSIGDYVGKAMTDVLKDELGELGYNVKIIEEFSGTVEKGVIVSQQPEPTAVRKLGGFTLELVVSKGKDIKSMPDYSLLNYLDVKYELLQAGYEVQTIMIDGDGLDFGMVVNTYPQAGATLESGAQISLFVSRGPQIHYITMPKLIGLSEKKVMDSIITNELCLGEIRYVETPSYASGTVLSQSITQDSYVPIRTKVDLVIAK